MQRPRFLVSTGGVGIALVGSRSVGEDHRVELSTLWRGLSRSAATVFFLTWSMTRTTARPRSTIVKHSLTACVGLVGTVVRW